jgi:hypothetical protein
MLATIFSIAILHVMLQPKTLNICLNQYYMLNLIPTYNLAYALNYEGLRFIHHHRIQYYGGCGGGG